MLIVGERDPVVIDLTTRPCGRWGVRPEVHRCGLLAAESRAGQRKYFDIELAVAHLHGTLELLRRTT